MADSMKNLLSSLSGTGEVITICYNGGSAPGVPRSIIVHEIKDDRITAIEPSTHANKSFLLNKILWVELSSGKRLTNTTSTPAEKIIPRFETFQEYVDYYLPELIAAGWTITQGENSLHVYGYFKNGKLKKTPYASIEYIDFETQEPIHTIEISLTGISLQSDTISLHNKRPWHVFGPVKGGALTHLWKAFERFIDNTRPFSPYA